MSTRASTSAPVRLLFVDDSRIQRGLWTRLLSQNSEITVVGALESAEEIPTALASLRPDVLLLDINLPGLSGVEFLEQCDLKKLPPCIIFSAFVRGTNKLRDRALAAGATSIISKPIQGSPAEIKEVFDTVRSAILRLHFGHDRAVTSSEGCAVQVPEFGARPPAVTPAHALATTAAPSTKRAIVIGSSTGGPAVLVLADAPLRGAFRVHASSRRPWCTRTVGAGATRSRCTPSRAPRARRTPQQASCVQMAPDCGGPWEM